ncbi:MAG: ABC transporter substrate-binding protein [Tissierellia bacterium]|nr:ABC transporter substrate-binding protein [Tissierellia bacterium]
MKKKRIFLLAGLFILAMALLGACSKDPGVGEPGDGQGQEAQKETPRVVRLAGGDYGLSQPYTTYSRGPGSYKVKLVFDGLVAKDDQGYIPWLAEDWEVQEEGKAYVFSLRDQVNWADGQPFGPEDVVFTFNYGQDHPPVGGGDLFGPEGILEGVEKTGDREVTFRLKAAQPNFIEEIFGMNILPQHIWEGVDRPDEFTGEESLIGTGPFRLTDYNKEHGTYRFEAREDFWGPKPAVDVIEFVPVSDPVMALENGDIDISGVPVDALARFEGKEDFTIMDNPGVFGTTLRFNMDKVEDFQSKEFRQAFAYAIDREEIVEKIARGAGEPGSLGILPPAHIMYNDKLPSYKKDLDQAKALIEKSGISPGTYELLVGDGQGERLGELIKEQLAAVGIDITVVTTDQKSKDARLAEGNYQLAINSYGGWARDADYLRVRFAPEVTSWSSGTPGYENPAFSKLAEDQRVETDEAKRRDQVMALQEILAEDVPEIPLYMSKDKTVYRNSSYDGWKYEFDHHEATHNKLSFLE